MVESIVPWLVYNSYVLVGHRTTEPGRPGGSSRSRGTQDQRRPGSAGGHSGNNVRLSAGERTGYKLQLAGETDGAWVRVREKVPSPQLSPVLAVSGVAECLAGDKLNTADLDVAGSTEPLVLRRREGRRRWHHRAYQCLRPAGVGLGMLFVRLAVLGSTQRSPGRTDAALFGGIRELVPPFGTRQFPVARGGNSHFSLMTRGDSIVLQMLRPSATGAKTYHVDSTISFGEEVPADSMT